MTKTNISIDLYFWLGADAEAFGVESLTEDEFDLRIAEYQEGFRKWQEVDVGEDVRTD